MPVFKNKDELNQVQMAEYAADLEREIHKLTPAAQMLEKISRLLIGEGNSTSTTLEVASLIKQRLMMLDIYTWLAIKALEFDAGDWEPEKQVRHLREQILLSLGYLSKATDPYAEHPHFMVSAGKFETIEGSVERNYKYSSANYYCLEDALADLLEHNTYPFAHIEFKGYEITAQESEK